MENQNEFENSNKIIEKDSERVETKGLKLKKSTKERLNELQSQYPDAESMIISLLKQNEFINLQSDEKFRDRKSEIEKFGYYLECLKESYLTSINTANYLEEKYKDKLVKELKGKEKTIIDMQQILIEKEDKISKLKSDYKEKDEKIKILEKNILSLNSNEENFKKELQEKSEIIKSNNNQISTLNDISKEYLDYKNNNNNIKEEVDKLKAISLEKQILNEKYISISERVNYLESLNLESKNEIISSKSEISSLNSKIQELIFNYSNEINTLKDYYSKEMLTFQKEKEQYQKDKNSVIDKLKEENYNLQLQLLKK